MFSDPQSVTINGSAVSLPRTSNGINTNVYSEADGDLVLTIKQTKTNARNRREVRVADTTTYANPLTGLSTREGLSVYLVIDEPHEGFDNTAIKQVVEGLKAWLTEANQDKVLGGEY